MNPPVTILIAVYTENLGATIIVNFNSLLKSPEFTAIVVMITKNNNKPITNYDDHEDQKSILRND